MTHHTTFRTTSLDLGFNLGLAKLAPCRCSARHHHGAAVLADDSSCLKAKTSVGLVPVRTSVCTRKGGGGVNIFVVDNTKSDEKEEEKKRKKNASRRRKNSLQSQWIQCRQSCRQSEQLPPLQLTFQIFLFFRTSKKKSAK